MRDGQEIKARAGYDAERTEIAYVVWSAVFGGPPKANTREVFDALNNPPGEHPTLLASFHAADDLLRSVAVVKALFDVRLTARLRSDKRATGARIGISDYSMPDLIVALRSWGDEMDRSASELMMAGQINAGGGSATVAALMKEAADRLEKGAAHG